MYSDNSVSNLVGEIYEGVTDPARWNNAMRQFVTLSGGHCAFLAIIDSSTRSLPVSTVVGPETSGLADALDLYRELIPLDPGLPYGLARPEGGNFRLSENSPALSTEPDTWRDFIHHDLGSGDYHSRFSAEQDGVSLVLALHTPAHLPRLTPEQEWLHAIVFDHLQRATRLAYRPPDLSLARQAVLVVNGEGLILDANGPAEAVLSDNDGLTVIQGRLCAGDPATNQTLHELIRRACRGNFNGNAEEFCVLRRPSGKRALLLKLGPLPLPNIGLPAVAYRCVIEILGGEGQQTPSFEHLCKQFGLTPREAEIACLFADSFNDLRSISEWLGISHETARVHARSIFAKCGVANQVELVRVLAGLR